MRAWLQPLAAGLWLMLAALNLGRGGWHPLTLLVAAQYALTALRLLRRRQTTQRTAWRWQALAWGSALLPLTLRADAVPSRLAGTGVLIQVAGLTLALWALWSLGLAFGIAPADRGLVMRGPYRWLRHPAYAGEALALLGFVFTFPSAWNVSVFLIVMAALALRMVMEEQAIAHYPAYARQVRWRLCPGVW